MVTCIISLKSLHAPLFLQFLTNLAIGKYRDLFGPDLTIAQLLVGRCLKIHSFRVLALTRAGRDVFDGNMIVDVVIGSCVVGDMVHLLHQVTVKVLASREIELSRLLLRKVRIERIVSLCCHRRGSQWLLLPIVLVT